MGNSAFSDDTMSYSLIPLLKLNFAEPVAVQNELSVFNNSSLFVAEPLS